MKKSHITIIVLLYSTTMYATEQTSPQTEKPKISELPLPEIPEAPAEKSVEIKPVNISEKILYDQIRQLLQAENTVPIVDILKNKDIPEEEVKKIVQDLVNNKNIDPYYKIALLFALGASPELAALQDFFFSLIDKPETEKEKYPIIWIATESDLSKQAIPGFLRYIAQAKNKENFANIVEKAIGRTIDDNGQQTLAVLQPLVTISPAQATEFLWRVVREDKKPEFVDLLKKMGAVIDDVGEIMHKDKPVRQTPLMLATENNRVNLVRALLDAGARADLAPAHDSIDARFIALDNGFTEVQDLLREYKN
jgi:ankyrin repeat protein